MEKTENTTGIYPCPFCGDASAARVSENAANMWVQCLACGSRGPEIDKKNQPFKTVMPQAVALWNDRVQGDNGTTQLAAVQEQLAAVQKQLDGVAKVMNSNMKPENKVAKITELMQPSG